ncbi:MAG: hypothetical protein DRN81_03880, partial [Thermoproteota archaeon]
MTDGEKLIPVKVNLIGSTSHDISVKTSIVAVNSTFHDIPLKTSILGSGSKDVPVKATVLVERVDYGLYGESSFSAAPRETIYFAQGGTPDKSIAATDPYWFIKSGSSETGKEGFMEIGIGQNDAHNQTDANLTAFVRVQQDQTSGEGEVKIKPLIWFYPGSQPTTAQEGMMYYDSTSHDYKFYNGSTWELVGGGASSGVSGSGTQYTIPVWDTSTSLTDSMIAQDSGGTITTISGMLQLDSFLGIDCIPAYALDIEGTTGASSSINIERYVDTSYGAAMYIKKARGTGVGNETIVNNDDQLFGFITYGWDGDSFANAASMEVYVDGTPSSTAMPGRIEFKTTPTSSQTLTSAMTIDSSQNTSIHGELKVYDNESSYYLQLGNTGTSGTGMLQSVTGVGYGMWFLDSNKIWAFSGNYSWSNTFKINTDYGTTGTTLLSSGGTASLKLDNVSNLTTYGQLNMTGTTASIDLNPSGTGSINVIDITPTNSLTAGSLWQGMYYDLSNLDPASGAVSNIYVSRINASSLASVDGNATIYGYMFYSPTNDNSTGFYHSIGELTTNKTTKAFATYGSGTYSKTGTYIGYLVDWATITRDAEAPVLQGIQINLPSDYTDFGGCYAGYFTGDGRNVTICDTTYAIDANGAVRLTGAVSGITTLTAGSGAFSIGSSGYIQDYPDMGSGTDGYILTYDHSTTSIKLAASSSGGPGTGTQWTLPVWNTTTTLGDSMISQDSGGTTATINGSISLIGNITRSTGQLTVSSSDNAVSIRSAAANAQYFDCGLNFEWRDIDNSYNVVMSLDSSTG